jgi:hypothetical protein
MKSSRSMGLLSGATLALRAVSTGLSADDPMSKTGRSVRRVLHSFVLLAAIAAPAAGQVIPTRPPVPSVPGGPLQRELPRLPTDDLIIQSVNVKDVVAPAPATIALVTIKNQGSADIVFPAGSVLARGDAARPGGINFPALTTPTEFMIAAGASKQLTLSVGDVCAAGHPGSVTFRVDPANVIRGKQRHVGAGVLLRLRRPPSGHHGDGEWAICGRIREKVDPELLSGYGDYTIPKRRIRTDPALSGRDVVAGNGKSCLVEIRLEGCEEHVG